MMTDYHNHLLPGMDDGAEDAATAMRMLSALEEQGVERVAATPHFYSHRESMEAFLQRRALAAAMIPDGVPPVRIVHGAEVYLERDISSLPELDKLSLRPSGLILLEFPYEPLKIWMTEEVYNIAYQFKLTPVLAHVERYFQWYGAEGMEELLSMRGVIFQLNNRSLEKRQTLKFALELIRGGYPVVFGSDAHNMGERAPDFNRARKVLASRLSKGELSGLEKLNESLFEPA